MRTLSRHRRRQRGAALILFITVLVLGVAWFAVGALGKAPVASAEREVKTGLALQAAKQALLSYVAQYAARSGTAEPGQMPCPELLNLSSPGTASTSCTTALEVGRLPWKTLGIDELRDGYGEPLWYMMRGFRNPPINFGTAGQLTYNGAAVVAMIIAPGVPRNTASTPGTPPAGCTKQDQMVAGRNTATLNPANFLECGVATGSIASPGDSTWTNDRVIAITAAEWVDAIAPAIGDRLQRQVAPAISNWDATELAATGRSWAVTHGAGYLPFASDWDDPTGTSTTLYCGNQGTDRGLMPIDPGCYNNPWTVASVTTGGLLSLFGTPNCVDQGSFMRCRFSRVLGIGAATARVTLNVANVARAFRGTLREQDITISNSGTKTISAMSIDNATSDATMVVDLAWPANLLIVALGQVVEVDIPHLQNAALHSDPRITWFWNNGWHRYAWYAVSPDATASNANAWDACDAAGDPGCLTVNGLPASTNANDKTLVLALSGRPLSGQMTPSADLAQYFELQNADFGVVYETNSSSSTFNDRVAACPFKYQNHSGANVVICN